MLTLCIDTSTTRGTVALCENGSVLKEIFWDKQSSHSEKIVTEIDELYKSCNKNIEETKKLICGIGPGSFTGLRVALSFVRTLAHSKSIPIVAVEDCWAIALNAVDTKQSVSVLLDAQKNMFFFGKYRWKNSFLETESSVSLVNDKELEKLLNNSLVITNSGDVLRQKNILFSNVEPFPSAAKIYNHVIQHPEKHEEIQWSDLHPLYLRASAAEEVLAAKNYKV